MALLAAAVIALTVLIIAPGYSFYFDVIPKLVVLLAGAGTLLIWAAFGGSLSRRWSGLFRWFSILLLLELVSLGISTIASARPEMSLFGTNWRHFGSVIQAGMLLFAWLVAAVCAGHPERVRVVLRGVTLAGLVSAVYGIVQYFGWDPLLPRAGYQVGDGIWAIVRPPGTLGYASYFATWLVMLVFLGPALARMEDSAAWRRVGLAVAPLAAVAMLLTGTRAAVLGLVVGAVVWGAMDRPGGLSYKTVSYGLIAILAAATFYSSPLGQPVRSRARWFAEDPWGGARLVLWQDSARMATHRLATGYGPEVFTAEFPHFESVELAKAYPGFAHESPHNMFLDVLVAQGLPGFVALAGLCGLAFATRRRPLLTAAIAAAIVSQQFTSFTVSTALILFVTLALLVALETESVAMPRRVRFVAGAIPVAAALLYVAIRLAIADHTLALAKRGLEAGDLASAASAFHTYERSRLPGGTADLWYSRALLNAASTARNPVARVAALVESAAAARHASETAEDPFNAWYTRAILYGSQNDAAGSERSLRAAIAAHPRWFKPHWILAQVLRLEGRVDEAKREALLAAELDGGKDQEVARTLREIRGDPQPLQR